MPSSPNRTEAFLTVHKLQLVKMLTIGNPAMDLANDSLHSTCTRLISEQGLLSGSQLSFFAGVPGSEMVWKTYGKHWSAYIH